MILVISISIESRPNILQTQDDITATVYVRLLWREWPVSHTEGWKRWLLSSDLSWACLGWISWELKSHWQNSLVVNQHVLTSKQSNFPWTWSTSSVFLIKEHKTFSQVATFCLARCVFDVKRFSVLRMMVTKRLRVSRCETGSKGWAFIWGPVSS